MRSTLGGHGFDYGKVSVRHLTAKALGLAHDSCIVHENPSLKCPRLGCIFAWAKASQDSVLFVNSLKFIEVLHHSLTAGQQTTKLVCGFISAFERNVGHSVLPSHSPHRNFHDVPIRAYHLSLPLRNDTHLYVTLWGLRVFIIPSAKVEIVIIKHLEDRTAILTSHECLCRAEVTNRIGVELSIPREQGWLFPRTPA